MPHYEPGRPLSHIPIGPSLGAQGARAWANADYREQVTEGSEVLVHFTLVKPFVRAAQRSREHLCVCERRAPSFDPELCSWLLAWGRAALRAGFDTRFAHLNGSHSSDALTSRASWSCAEK